MRSQFNESVCGPEMKVCEPTPRGNVTDLAKENSIASYELMRLAKAINGHLFGREDVEERDKNEPRCFVDELLLTNGQLKAAVEVLHEICAKLGV